MLDDKDLDSKNSQKGYIYVFDKNSCLIAKQINITSNPHADQSHLHHA